MHRRRRRHTVAPKPQPQPAQARLSVSPRRLSAAVCPVAAATTAVEDVVLLLQCTVRIAPSKVSSRLYIDTMQGRQSEKVPTCVYHSRKVDETSTHGMVTDRLNKFASVNSPSLSTLLHSHTDSISFTLSRSLARILLQSRLAGLA